jgi:hypothetical protein
VVGSGLLVFFFIFFGLVGFAFISWKLETGNRLGGGIGYWKRNVNLKHESIDFEFWAGLVYCEIWLRFRDFGNLCCVVCTDRFCLFGDGDDVDMVHVLRNYEDSLF